MAEIKIKKKYHFYAAHRNKYADEKCGRIHGHTYYVECTFLMNEPGIGGVTILFSDIDKIVEPIIKKYDHHLLLHDADNLCKILDNCKEPYICLPFDTSAENMAKHLYTTIKKAGMNIIHLSLQETNTSIVTYED